MTPDPAIATAADYADALMTARRAKNAFVLILVLLLLAELAIFFVAKYTDLIIPTAAATATAPTTGPSPRWFDWLQYVTGLAVFLGVTLSLVLAMVVYLLVQIMLVGRLIGVSRLTAAFVLSLIVVVFLFPWQAFLSNATFNDPSFKIPGVLYTWEELLVSAKLGIDVSPGQDRPDIARLILHWARFVAMPIVAIVLLLMIQVKSNRGLRQALGEESVLDDGTLNPEP